MSAIGIIPARYGSSRFPGKPLKDLAGKPVIQHVVERSLQALPDVIVATDDERILNAVKGFGGRAMLTRKDHPSGSDRIAEIAQKVDAEIVVNIQGDEPFIEPDMIRAALAPIQADPTIQMVTVMRRLQDPEDAANPNIVKVIADQKGFALYFSRSLIPYPRYEGHSPVYEHVGLYVYRRAFLLDFIQWPPTPLEKTESLEQLRVLENGFKIKLVETELGCGAPCIDTPEDLERARKYIQA